MQTNNILSAPLIDLIFDGRNKEYGAYELRKAYHKRISKALIITSVMAAMAFGGAALASSVKKKDNQYKISDSIALIEVPDEKKPEPLPEEPKPKPEEVQVKTEKLTDMVIKPDEEVTDPPPTQEDLIDAKIGTEKINGVDDQGIAEPDKVPGDDKGIIETKPKEDKDEIVPVVQIEAKYIGNWEKFLRQNLNPEVPVNNSAPAGTYSVVIQFVVDKEGNVSDIKPLTNHGYGMEQEAVRVLKKATKWEPAIQNGYVVKAYRRQPITFQVLEE